MRSGALSGPSAHDAQDVQDAINTLTESHISLRFMFSLLEQVYTF